MKGFGLIGLIITIAIIGLMVYGTFYYGKSKPTDQVQTGQNAIEDANDAANTQTQYNQTLQNDVQGIDSTGVNYRSVQDKLR